MSGSQVTPVKDYANRLFHNDGMSGVCNDPLPMHAGQAGNNII